MGLSDPMATPIILAANTGRSQTGAQSPGAVGHYANQQNVDTNPQPGPKPRVRLRRGRDSVPGPARGPKPTRTAS